MGLWFFVQHIIESDENACGSFNYKCCVHDDGDATCDQSLNNQYLTCSNKNICLYGPGGKCSEDSACTTNKCVADTADGFVKYCQ